MRALPALALAVLTGLAVAAGFATAQETANPTIPWETDLAKARERAAKEGRPLFLVFRCGP